MTGSPTGSPRTSQSSRTTGGGTGRSPRPAAWGTTSPEEQADDAAALLDALGLAPAAVFGTSSGGIFALAMLVRHRHALRAAVLHEPALFTLFDDPEEARNRVTEVVTAVMEAGGPLVALESIIRLVAGDANWEQLDPTVRERMFASAGTYFGNEIGKFDTYLPDDETLASIVVPVHVLVGEDSLPYINPDGSPPEWTGDQSGHRNTLGMARKTPHLPAPTHPAAPTARTAESPPTTSAGRLQC